ncbi:MAG: hypothetical protein B7X10_06395, partial [Burkholderiales bacterium 21-58-4]
DGASAYLMQTASGSPLGTFNGLRPFAWALTTGGVTIDGTGAGTTMGGPLAIGAGAFGSGASNRVTTAGDFINSYGLDGYQYLPNGFLIQWGQLGIGASTSPTTYNFAYAFPNACFGMVIAYEGDLPATYGSVGATPISKTQFIATNTNTQGGSNGTFYIAVGY